MRNQFYMLGNIVVVVSANLLLMHSQLYIYLAFCFSVSAKGSSKSGVCYTSSHVHNFITSSHLLTFTSSHLHFFTSSHLHIFSSSDLHIFSSSHRHIFTPSYPHICTSSHVHTLSPAQLHTSSLSFSLLHIFSSSSHLLSLSPFLSLSLALLPSVTVSLLLFLFSLKAAGGADEAPRYCHPFAQNEVRVSKNCSKNCRCVGGNAFARNEVRVSKTAVKLLILKCRRQRFRTE